MAIGQKLTKVQASEDKEIKAAITNMHLLHCFSCSNFFDTTVYHDVISTTNSNTEL